MRKKVAVVLSGCGFLDGAEIRESVITLLEIARNNADYDIFAPDIQQSEVVNHLTGEKTLEVRNVLQESARIARGKISPLSKLEAEQYSALIIPGGFGVAKNLSDFAQKGSECIVLEGFRNAILGFVRLKKPVGAICIAPAVVAAVLGVDYAPSLTIGDDEGVAREIEKLGARHMVCQTEEIHLDFANKIVSCSAYMREDDLAKIGEGIAKLVKKVMELAI
jgi:enhancing lycopene biosynthesis protein 2